MNWPRLFDLTGRCGLVTGAAGLLGTTFVEALTAHGARVAALDLQPVAAAEGVLPLACDLTQPDQVRAAVARAREEFGGLDFLLNNAVAPVADPARHFAAFEDYDLGEWRRVMEVNLEAMVTVAQEVGKVLVEQGRGGSIVQTASIYGVMAADNRIYEGSRFQDFAINNPAVYGASKAGVISLTRWMATYWAKDNIRVNAVAPGGVFSEENDNFVQRYSARIPLGRMAHRHEIAGTMVYLVSDASTYMTGQCLMLDGGLSAW